ncbi:hypothetical protein LCGC14_0739840 [marine sediment metagenome]|uniref:Uncharacterized protein n=1 Tax=marine sediment metagenome TaxID=412755 RepID=A0A0F9TEB7_9ZZZZ
MDQKEVDVIKASLADATYNELVAAMIQTKEAHDVLKQRTSEAWDVVCVIARQVIPARFEQDQIQNITVILPDGTKKRLLVLPKVSVKTPEENKMLLRDWLREHEAAEIISETVNASTLAAYVGAQMKAGEPYPNDICEISTYETASLRKA